MKTKEFIKKVEELGFKVNESRCFINILSDNLQVAYVLKDQQYALECNSVIKVKFMSMDKLFDLLVEYARTPIEEREEEKKYYLRHRWIKTKNGNWTYMALRKRPNISYMTLQGSDEDIFEYQVRFTREEIDEIKEKFNTDLSEFEEKEVGE